MSLRTSSTAFVRKEYWRSLCCILVIGGAAGTCLPKPAALRVSDQEIRATLLQELASRAPSRPAPDSTTTVFTVVPSTAVQGLNYHWAEYYPAGTMHVRFVAVLGVQDTVHTIIRTDEDWLALKGSFLPGSPSEALQACGEWIHTTSPIRIPNLPPKIFQGPGTFGSLELPLPDQDYLRDNLTEPEVQQHREGWNAVFWAIGPRVVRKYECQLFPTGGSLVVRDSLPGYGYIW